MFLMVLFLLFNFKGKFFRVLFIMRHYIQWLFIVGVLWAPLFTVFYWQLGTHKALDDSIRNRKANSFLEKFFKLFLISIFGIFERWLISIACLVFLFFSKIM